MKDTELFFDIAKPKWEPKEVCTQMGVHIEEVGEMFEAMGFEADSTTLDEINLLANHYKTHKYPAVEMSDWDRANLLDSLCDQYVTLIGVAKSLGMDIKGAVQEVEDSNLSKFLKIEEGTLKMDLDEICVLIEKRTKYKGVYSKPVLGYHVFYDENGKIMKNPSTYFEPDLSKFI